MAIVCLLSGCLSRNSEPYSMYPLVYSSVITSAMDNQASGLTAMLDAMDSYISGDIDAVQAADYIARSRCRLDVAFSQVNSLLAPEGRESSHEKLLAGSARYIEASSTFEDSLKRMDEQEVGTGFRLLDEADSLINQASEEFKVE